MSGSQTSAVRNLTELAELIRHVFAMHQGYLVYWMSDTSSPDRDDVPEAVNDASFCAILTMDGSSGHAVAAPLVETLTF